VGEECWEDEDGGYGVNGYPFLVELDGVSYHDVRVLACEHEHEQEHEHDDAVVVVLERNCEFPCFIALAIAFP